jgi:hypothetical protein
MMKRPQVLLRGSFIVAGLALATLAVQHALNVDSAALVTDPADAPRAPQPTYSVYAPPGSGSGRALGPAAMLERSESPYRDGTTPEPTNDGSSFMDVLRRLPFMDLWLDTPQPEPTGQARDSETGVGVATPGAAAAPAAAAAPTAAGTGSSASDRCGPPVAGAQTQGVTADVDFVGVLLNGNEQNADSFSGAQLSDLKIIVQWRHLLQNHAQRLDLIAPDGSLYQSLSRPLTVADEGNGVETRVPVSGSWITRFGLYGSWCVAVFFDQDEAAITTARVAIAR